MFDVTFEAQSTTIVPTYYYLLIVSFKNATVGSTILQVRAVDSDIGNNGVVRYKFRQEFSRHWEAFHIDATTGVLTLAQPLDREKQKIYHVQKKSFFIPIPFLLLRNIFFLTDSFFGLESRSISSIMNTMCVWMCGFTFILFFGRRRMMIIVGFCLS